MPDVTIQKVLICGMYDAAGQYRCVLKRYRRVADAEVHVRQRERGEQAHASDTAGA